MRLSLALLLVSCLPVPVRAQDPLAPLGWLGGCWEIRKGTRVTLETWMPPAGGLMIGGSRTVANGAVREYEHLRLWNDQGQLVYTALPSGQPEASFRATTVTADGFTVENLQHDFPQRIIYRRVGPDSLVARIEGPGPNGTRGIDFPYARVPCEG